MMKKMIKQFFGKKNKPDYICNVMNEERENNMILNDQEQYKIN